MSSLFRQQLESYVANLKINAEKVLDVGGLQFPIKGRVAEWNVQDYKILDVEEEMKGRKADYVGDISHSLDYREWMPEIQEENDVVFCLEVMEYVFNPVQAMKNVALFCKPGGTAYISFPFVYPMHPPLDTDYLRFTRHGVERLLKEAGFSKWEISVRKATRGASALKQFYDQEGMKYRRDDLTLLTDIGYIVKATV
jgi:SAM-dependent methyltransferase